MTAPPIEKRGRAYPAASATHEVTQTIDNPAPDASAETASEERWETRYPRVRAVISALGDIRVGPLEYVDRQCGFHCEIEMDVSSAESAKDEVAAALRGVIKLMLAKRVEERGSR